MQQKPRQTPAEPRQTPEERNKANLQEQEHTEHCKIDETEAARVESTHQQNGRQ